MNISRPSSLPAALLLVLLATGCEEEPSWSNVHTVVPMVTERHEPRGLGPRLPLERQVALAEPDNILEPDPALAVAPPAEGGTLRRGLRSWLPSRYTWMTENLVSVSEINSYVNEGIARPHVNAPDRWAPGLADRVTVSDDGRVYRIHLEKGVLWPEPFSPFLFDVGEKVVEVTSEDFAFAFEMMRDPRVERAGPARSWYSDCTELRVLDPYTFEMVWSEPGLAARIWTLSFTPLPKHIFSRAEDGTRYRDPAAHLETHWHRWPMGVGPYRASSIIDDQMIRLERNPRYHGATPPIENLELSAYTKASDLFADLRADRLDVVQIPSWFAGEEVGGRTLLDLASSMDGIHVLDMKQLGYSHIGWNLRHGPTRHVEVRRALTMALDRERIIDEVYGGHGNVSTGPYSSMTPYASPEIDPLPFDLQAARRLLEENNWESVRQGVREKRNEFGRERLELELLVASDAEQRIADIFAADAARIGILITTTYKPGLDSWDAMTVPLESSGASERYLAGYFGGWGHDWEDDPFQLWHSSQADVVGGSNPIGFANPEADALIEAIRHEPDPDKRLALHHQFHALIADLQPYTFISEDISLMIYNERIEGVRFSKSRPHDSSLFWGLRP